MHSVIHSGSRVSMLYVRTYYNITLLQNFNNCAQHARSSTYSTATRNFTWRLLQTFRRFGCPTPWTQVVLLADKGICFALLEVFCVVSNKVRLRSQHAPLTHPPLDLIPTFSKMADHGSSESGVARGERELLLPVDPDAVIDAALASEQASLESRAVALHLDSIASGLPQSKRVEFLFPRTPATATVRPVGSECIYLCGNSLGLQPRGVSRPTPPTHSLTHSHIHTQAPIPS